MTYPDGGPQQPNPGWQPGPQQPGPQQPSPQQPGPQHQQGPQYPVPQHPGQPYPGQPYPGRQYPGHQQYPGQQYQGQPYPGQPYPGQPPHPRRAGPNKVMPVVAALLFLPGVILGYVASFPVVAQEVVSPYLGVSLFGLPLTEAVTGNIDFAVSLTLTVVSLVLCLAVLLACRVPGVRWALVAIAALVTVSNVWAIIEVLANWPSEWVVVPAISLVLWLVAALVAALPVVGRAMRGGHPAGPPAMPGPPPPAHW